MKHHIKETIEPYTHLTRVRVQSNISAHHNLREFFFNHLQSAWNDPGGVVALLSVIRLELLIDLREKYERLDSVSIIIGKTR